MATIAFASFLAEPAAAQRGIPIPGAKITFSNDPNGSNPKTSFSSSEFIYGRLDLAGTCGAPYLGGIRDVQMIDCAAVK